MTASQDASPRRLHACALALALTLPAAAHAALVSDYHFDDSSQTSGNGATRIVDDGPAAVHGDLRWNNAFYNVATPVAGGPTFPASGAGEPGDFLGGDHGTALSLGASGIDNAGHIALGGITAHDFERLDFTIAGWFSKSGTAGQGIIYDNAVQDFGGQLIYVNADGKLAFEIKGGPTPSVGDNIAVLSDAAVNDGQWHSFVALVSSETALLYIDGVQQSQTAVYGTLTKARPTGGKGTRMVVEFGGEVDTLQIFSHALTPGEIAAFTGVPEPASAALVGLGGLLMLRRRGR